MTIYTLVNAKTTNTTVPDDTVSMSPMTGMGPGRRTAKASISGTGEVSATVTLYGNHDNSGSGGVLLYTFPLSGTNSDISLAPNVGEEIPEYPFYYVVIASISGIGAAVTFTLSVGGA